MTEFLYIWFKESWSNTEKELSLLSSSELDVSFKLQFSILLTLAF